MEVNNKSTKNSCLLESAMQVEPKKRNYEESDIALLPKEVTMLGVLPTTENSNFVSAKAIAPNVKRLKPNESERMKMMMKMVGRPIDGVVDGVFDAGYLMSVRIGGSDTIYRGVVFGPGLVVPPSVPGYRSEEMGMEFVGSGSDNASDHVKPITNGN